MTDIKKDLSDILIVSDFDGTLRGSEGFIPQNNIIAIERLKSLGGVFVVASGRAGFVLDAVEPKIKDLVNGPCVFSNGSYFYDYITEERSNEKYIEESVVRDMLYIVKNIDSKAGIRIVRGDEYFTPDKNEEIKRQISKGYMKNVIVSDYETIPVDRINKFTVCANENSILNIKDKFLEAVEEKYSEYVDIFLSWKTLIDVQPKNVSKGLAVRELREIYKNAGKNMRIFAVGDYENDIDMLKSADYACCPSNSLENVKEFCKIHLCSNDDGCIADLIDRIENGLV